MRVIDVFRHVAALIFLAATSAAWTQTGANGLDAYANCSFSDGLQVVHTDPLPPGLSARPVETDNGTRRISLEAGMRIMLAYPDTDFYANVKAERLPAANFDELKGYLIENFRYLSKGNIVNTSLQSPMNGFEVHGLDREKLEGGVLGVYLLFNAADHTVTTIYLLNQEPQSRKFQTIEEYRTLRDRFLGAYTGCIHSNLAKPK